MEEVENGGEEAREEVPNLDEPAPPHMEAQPARTSLRLNSSSLASDDGDNGDITELSFEEGNGFADGVDMSMMDATYDSMQDQSSDLTDFVGGVTQNESNEAEEKPETAVEDAEMVSEDELMPENKEPLDTEAVSDDELKEESQGPLETEEVSDDELPEDKRKKAKVEEAEAVSEDELPDDVEKKPKTGESGEKSDEGTKKDKKRKLAEGDYDPSSPTSENSNDATPAKKAALDDDAAQTAGKKGLPELEKYWKAVKDDPSDFTGWTYLLQYVDQENDMDVAREAYDSFLLHYPYCYGYWRKYADYEKRKGNTEECERVFARGLIAIPLSVDLWLHYLNYIKASYAEDKDHVRAQYERALDACGLEFRSDRLWESYIKWEKEQKNLINITAIYDRLLAIPTQGYTTHFDSLQDHVNSNPPQTILPVDDFLELRREVVAELKENAKAMAASAAADDDAPPGEEADPDKEDDTIASSTARMEEETNALREKIIAQRRKIHKLTVAAVAARWNFEEGIKRPYFHVKPLERCQLKNWRDYLEFEIEQGNEKRIITLFERGLIACALYEEFWITFIKYLKGMPESQTEKIRDVYERACQVHHKKKSNLHLQWAAFEETVGNFDKAATILADVENTTSNLLQVAYRRINLERRRGNSERVCQLYEEYIEANKGKSNIFTNMTVKYARFVWKFMGDIDKAIDILEKALELEKENTRLYLQLIDMGLQKSPVDEDRILAILDQFLDKEGDLDQKLMFAQRKIEFLEDFGSSIDRVQKAQDDFQKYVKQVKDKKKRQDTEPPTTPSSSAKKSKSSDSSSANPPMPSAPPPSNSQSNYQSNQYPANYYGQYPPPTGTNDQYSNNYNNYNYSNWSNYPQGQYNANYSATGWPGYYPTNY